MKFSVMILNCSCGYNVNLIVALKCG